jgi:hypothetical protein
MQLTTRLGLKRLQVNVWPPRSQQGVQPEPRCLDHIRSRTQRAVLYQKKHGHLGGVF